MTLLSRFTVPGAIALLAIVPRASAAEHVETARRRECPPLMETVQMPHAMAIALVVAQRSDEIAALDRKLGDGSPWLDTHGRSWEATRPAAPGILDTTHAFEVVYRIDGVAVGRWAVDLAAQRVHDPGESFTWCRS